MDAALAVRATEVACNALQVLQRFRAFFGPPNGEVHGFEGALGRLRHLYDPPPPPRVRRPKRRTNKPRVMARPLSARERRVLEEGLAASAAAGEDWKPEPAWEARACQALLMEIIRRAVHDYVLYRQHRNAEFKQRAEHAYIWLFEEEPGHPAWKMREQAFFRVLDGEREVVEMGSRRLTSFLSICEACELDPETVRARARETTVDSILRSGRRTERRKPRSNNESMSIETHSFCVDIDIDALDAESVYDQTASHGSREDYAFDSQW